jgi:hypothetical protein
LLAVQAAVSNMPATAIRRRAEGSRWPPLDTGSNNMMTPFLCSAGIKRFLGPSGNSIIRLRLIISGGGKKCKPLITLGSIIYIDPVRELGFRHVLG